MNEESRHALQSQLRHLTELARTCVDKQEKAQKEYREAVMEETDLARRINALENDLGISGTRIAVPRGNFGSLGWKLKLPDDSRVVSLDGVTGVATVATHEFRR